MSDFLVVLDARDQPAVPLAGPELVLDAVAAHGWFRDVDQAQVAATDPTFTSHISLNEVPPLVPDADPRVLTTDADEAGAAGWQAWAEPAFGAPCLWVVPFGPSVPHDLVAAFAASVSSTAPGPALGAARGHPGAPPARASPLTFARTIPDARARPLPSGGAGLPASRAATIAVHNRSGRCRPGGFATP